MGDGKTAQQIASEAYYAAHQNWENHQGRPLPPWADVRSDIKNAWTAAVSAVIQTLIPPNEGPLP